MAKKSIGYRDIILDARKKKFAPLYILHGEEPYYLDLVCSAIEANAVAEEDRDFNQNIFFGQDTDCDTVIGAAKQFPVMAERRLVVLKEAQTMRQGKTSLEALEPYFKRPNPTCVFVLVFNGDTLNKTSKLMKAAEASGAVILTSPKIRDYQIAGHILDYCQARKVSIDEKAASMLADFLGTSLSKIFGEIDKLLIAGGKGVTRITPEIIERNIGVSKDYNSFELTGALATGDYTKAMRIVDAFARNPRQNPAVVISSTLFNFYQKMVIATFQRDRSDASLMGALGLKTPYALKDIKAGMRYISAAKAVRCVHAIRQFDCMIKGIGSMQKEHELLKELIFKLFSL